MSERTPLSVDATHVKDAGSTEEHAPVRRDTPSTREKKRRWRKKLLYLVAAKHFLEQKKLQPLSWKAGSLALIKSTWMNVLFLAVLVLPFVQGQEGARFAVGSIALLPLATLLGDVTEKVAYHTTDTIGGLLNATFGNATEVIVSVFAMRLGLIDVVQSSLLGSVLSNMLLVLGTAFVAAGLKQKVAKFNRLAASANTSLLLVVVLAIAVPAVLTTTGDIEKAAIKSYSHFIALLMLCAYGVYIYFQLSSHAILFEDDDESPKSPARRATGEQGFQQVVLAAAHAHGLPPFDGATELLEEDDDDFVLAPNVAIAWLALLTFMISLLSKVICDAIEGAAIAWNLPRAFVGFVLLPIVGNAAEHATAIGMAYREKLDLAIAVALGSSTQIALFVIPLMVVIGWLVPGLDNDMTLDFPPFETTVTMLSVIIVAFQVQVGEATYLSGMVLVVAYVIIAVSFVFINRKDKMIAVPGDPARRLRGAYY